MPDTGRRERWHNEYDFGGVEERLRRAAELFAAEAVDLVVALGDLAHDGDEPSLRRALAPLVDGPPLLVVGGNHDGVEPTAALRPLAQEGVTLLSWRAVPAGRPDAGIRVAGVRMACRGSHAWVLARRPALATWGDAPVLLATHLPVLSRADVVEAAGLPYAGDLLDRAELAAPLLARTAPTVAVCGHMHVRESVAERSLLQLACCALVEPPFEVTVLQVEAGAGRRLLVTRTAHELEGATAMRRDPRLAPNRERWAFSPERGWRRSRPGAPRPPAPRRAR